MRDGPEQSQAIDARPPPRAAGGAAPSRRCPRPVPHRLRPATRCLGGRRGHRRRSVGGARARGCRTSRRAGVLPVAHDGTERCSVRPQDAAEQTACESGKTKDHTVKHGLLVNAPLTILFLSATHGGRVLSSASPRPCRIPCRRGVGCCRIWAFWRAHSRRSRSASRRRNPVARSSPASSKQPIRRCTTAEGIRDFVMELCCALHNFRVRLTPRQPMI
jgi:hypothetical protein